MLYDQASQISKRVTKRRIELARTVLRLHVGITLMHTPRFHALFNCAAAASRLLVFFFTPHICTLDSPGKRDRQCQYAAEEVVFIFPFADPPQVLLPYTPRTRDPLSCELCARRAFPGVRAWPYKRRVLLLTSFALKNFDAPAYVIADLQIIGSRVPRVCSREFVSRR